MRIAFVCTGNEFTNNVLYKENYFIRAALEAGHEVIVFASQLAYRNGKSIKCPTGEEVVDGYRLVRMRYKSHGGPYLTGKIRDTPHLIKRIIEYKPGLVFFNCPQTLNLKQIRYIKEDNPNCRIVLDFSTSYGNSARNSLSLRVLHKGVYRSWIQKALPSVDKVYYVSPEAKQFAEEVYGIPKERMALNGLPGKLVEPGTRQSSREALIKTFNLPDDSIIMAHSGKLCKAKKTVELMESFSRIEDERFQLFVIGTLDDEVRYPVSKLAAADKRIHLLDFMTGDELSVFLCGVDLYLQPGSVSQTAQTAICCGCPVMLFDCPNNRILVKDNGFLIKSVNDIDEVFNNVLDEPNCLGEMSNNAFKLAREELDYTVLFDKALTLAFS